MYTAIQHLHSAWAYLVVILVLVTVVNAIIGLIGKRNFGARDFRISLFTLIVAHFQLVIGLVIFFVSPKILWFSDGVEKSSIMKDSMTRLLNLEHPLMMIIALVLITMGYSLHKRRPTSGSKFKVLLTFNLIALALILARIPWSLWF